MSQLASDLLEVRHYPRGALVEHLLYVLVTNIIAPGCGDFRKDWI